MGKKITVCIPSYNRAKLLGDLLDSIINQSYTDYNILICEDKSSEREQIRSLVQKYQANYPGLINYIENEKNLGYDGNIRNLVAKADGRYCLFMGNDDLMAPHALATVGNALERYQDVGVILRSYASFNESTERPTQTYKYFDREIFFPKGESTIITFYRRSVVISGVVIKRDEALHYSTDIFDGTLLYQIYLVANVLATMNGLFLPDILAYYREGGIPDFGNSESEKGKFVPKQQTPDSSVHFLRGMLEIVKYTEKKQNLPIYRPILKDIGNYFYPILAIQASRPFIIFCDYAFKLAKLGFWRCGMFYVYFLSILILKPKRIEKMIAYIKTRLGYTPKSEMYIKEVAIENTCCW